MSFVKSKLGAKGARKVGIQVGDAFQIPPHFSTGFSMIGDSRTSDLHLGSGLNGRNWFNWACAFYKQYPTLVGNYGVSGLRSDEYLTNGNFETALQDSAGWLIFGYPVVNDISQASAGYTDKFGRAITIANVVANTVATLVAHARRALAVGKRVIMLTEPGSASMNAAQTAAVHEFNKALRYAVAGVPGVILFDPTRLIWNPTASATGIVVRANFSADGTHADVLQGRAVGLEFAQKILPTILPLIDNAPMSASDNIANATTQLFRNPIYINGTGGTVGANVTLNSGVLPANVNIAGSAAGAGLTVDATVQPSADGLGNELKLIVSCTAATRLDIAHVIANADLALTTVGEFGVEMDMAAGAVNCAYQAELQLATNLSTNQHWALYQTGSTCWAGGETGLNFRSQKKGFPAGASISWAHGRVSLVFSAAGSATITLRRPWFNKTA